MPGIVCILEKPLSEIQKRLNLSLDNGLMTVIDGYEVQLVAPCGYSYFVDRSGDTTYLAMPRNPAEPPRCRAIPDTAGQQPTVEATRQPDKAVHSNVQLLRFSIGTP